MGLQLTLVGEEGSAGQLLDGRVMYANALEDSDLVGEATPGGLETFTVLRSSQSPERHTFRIEGVGGPFVLTPTASGGIEVRRASDGQAVASIAPPTAVAADGAPGAGWRTSHAAPK